MTINGRPSIEFPPINTSLMYTISSNIKHNLISAEDTSYTALHDVCKRISGYVEDTLSDSHKSIAEIGAENTNLKSKFISAKEKIIEFEGKYEETGNEVYKELIEREKEIVSGKIDDSQQEFLSNIKTLAEASSNIEQPALATELEAAREETEAELKPVSDALDDARLQLEEYQKDKEAIKGTLEIMNQQSWLDTILDFIPTPSGLAEAMGIAATEAELAMFELAIEAYKNFFGILAGGFSYNKLLDAFNGVSEKVDEWRGRVKELEVEYDKLSGELKNIDAMCEVETGRFKFTDEVENFEKTYQLYIDEQSNLIPDDYYYDQLMDLCDQLDSHLSDA